MELFNYNLGWILEARAFEALADSIQVVSDRSYAHEHTLPQVGLLLSCVIGKRREHSSLALLIDHVPEFLSSCQPMVAVRSGSLGHSDRGLESFLAHECSSWPFCVRFYT